MARPLSPKLSPALITEAALEMVDQRGEFTIPELAKRLKVSPSSLYNHVSGKDDIIELMRGAAVAAIALPSPGMDWVDAVRDIAVKYRDSYARHPRLIPLLTAHAVRDATTIGMYNVLAELFTSAGFAPRRVLEAITVLDSYVLGSALDVAAPDNVWDPGELASDALRDALDAGLGHPGRADDAFTFGLDLIINGLAAHVHAG
ncbi:TetR/AcrR family transcriptional regulator C-terminal domain-containing protein [Arthrobacter sp. 35W]|uniref:TetR/AcrR family transcriptional regulator C-terminal domain-containing protein n=1 Tax=Arthrobacter sp. 35W TaxID=1132441 RepID=UPI000402DA4C|nr:TetR/AcrR family transcriptional regulator C-terminal domain-containing protein [Arthrobacter sp. 35W]